MDNLSDEENHDWGMPPRRPKSRLQQSQNVQQYVKNVKELFESIDSTIKNEVVPPKATKLEKDQLIFTLDQIKEQVLRQIVRSVRDHDDYGYTEPIIIPNQAFKKSSM